MAPKYPDEVDVFTVPHSRMKHLVHKYFDMVSSTNFKDVSCMISVLEKLCHTFHEFKTHEQIENRFIMRRLKEKLSALSITDTAVCNCHSDNRLTEMLDLVLDGYRWAQRSEQDRVKYGLRLRHALEDFTEMFIPHMKEEEEVFQPMLIEYFTYDELKELKVKVIQQHQEEVDDNEKYAQTDTEFKDDKKEGPVSQSEFSRLPSEILLRIFSHLSPKDLIRCAQVSHRWNYLALDPVLWPVIYPVQWAAGDWSFKPVLTVKTEEELVSMDAGQCCYGIDEDADVDESCGCDLFDVELNASLKQVLNEAKIISALVKYVLPRVGSGVRNCDLAHSRGLSSSMMHKILKLCPNLERLDLSYTKITDSAFKECDQKVQRLQFYSKDAVHFKIISLPTPDDIYLFQHSCHFGSNVGSLEMFGLKGGTGNLHYLDLTGCENVTDATLFSLSGSHSASDDLNPFPSTSSHVQSLYHRMSHSGEKTVGNIVSTLGIDVRNEGKSLPFRKYYMSGCAEGQMAPSVDVDLLSIVFSPLKKESVFKKNQSVTDPSCGLCNLECRERNLCSKQVNCNPGDIFSCDLLRQDLERNDTKRGEYQQISAKRTNCCGRGRKPLKFNDSNDNKKMASPNALRGLTFLSLNGCFRITDVGLRVLSERGGLSKLQYLDLSGCLNLSCLGVAALVDTSPFLDHTNLFYCDNIYPDPFPSTASGCRNLQCPIRVCCRSGE